MNVTFAPHDWTNIGFFACVIGAAIVAGTNSLGRDENMKAQLTTDENRVPAFLVALLIVAGICIFIFGPKKP